MAAKRKINVTQPGKVDGTLLFLEIARILEKTLDMERIVNPIMECISKHLSARHATMTIFNRATNEVQIEAALGLTPQQTSRGRYKLGEGVTGKVAQSGDPMIIKKTLESPLYLNRTERATGEMSFICVPIKAGKNVIGTLSVDRDYDDSADLDSLSDALQIVASLVAQAAEIRRQAQENSHKLEEENQLLREQLKDRFRPSNIIGTSHEMQEVYDQIAQVSSSATSVLIQGETGTGKELVAAAIHYNSDRSDKTFVKAHCAALPENIIESELFGHVKGAFTGATSDRKGRFELADNGTLFLDEIGEIPPSIQIKLLRVIQEREFERVGDIKTIKVNVRLIAATNKDLQAMSAEGKFREDLFYRLNVFPIFVPPLHKRKSDILLLADHFLEKYSRDSGKDVRRLSSEVIDMLYSYHWPGNVRELENMVERAVLLTEGDVVYPHHLPPTLQTAEATGRRPESSLRESVDSFERDLIVDALKSTRGNMASAARSLKTTQRIFGYKVHKYGIDAKKYVG
ncbi:MAG: sigma 54-interacting transcriptional regulator [Verrucomicrobiota bacterium]